MHRFTATILLCGLPLFGQPKVKGLGKFEMEGIHLGMPLKEAMAALKERHANPKLGPDNYSHPGLPAPLTYGLNAVGGGEGFYFLLSMPPDEPAILRMTWVIHYGEEKVPKQDVVAANLVRQFG